MHSLKAFEPDGISPLFYKIYLHIYGNDVKSMVLKILNNKKIPDDINKTFTLLIPKGKRPKNQKEFRPISLCNVIMKIVTKTIANRLKPILSYMIEEEQSVFVKDRLIMDNQLKPLSHIHLHGIKT